MKTYGSLSSGTLVEGSLHPPTPLGESSKDELLSKAGADPFCSTDCEIAKDKTDTAIRARKVEIRQAGCREIAAQARVVWH